MNRTELLKNYRVIATLKGLKGDLILATKNNGGDCEAVRLNVDHDYVVSDILEPISREPLVDFAERVLEIMSADEEWGADTLDTIADQAMSLKLASLTSDGYFCRTVD